MRGVNKIILLGQLGADPEVRATQTGSSVVNISVATNEEWVNKKTMRKESKTEWHKVVLFNKLAEIAAEYLKKGSQVYIEGKIQTKKWQDQSGNNRFSTEIVANEMQMIGGRSEATKDYDAPPTQSNSKLVPESAPSSEADFDDDLPF